VEIMHITKPKNEGEKVFIEVINDKYGSREFLTQEEIDEVFQIAKMMEVIY
jgi:hypothetical protein